MDPEEDWELLGPLEEVAVAAEAAVVVVVDDGRTKPS